MADDSRLAELMAVDKAARAAVVKQLDRTMFLEAGAGSGKTKCLVDRFVALVESGIDAATIAAITFTERAAAELADRIRAELQQRAAKSPRCAAALDVLDRAAICTLHSFAQRVLVAHPIEAGLPPRVEVLDEITSEVAFQRRWEAFVERILEDPALEQPLRLLLACNVRIDQLRDVARAFGDNWDLVEARMGENVTRLIRLDVEELCEAIDAVVARAGECRDADDRLLARLNELAEYSLELRAAGDDDPLIELLRRAKPSFTGRLGQKGNWPDVDSVRDAMSAAGALRDTVRNRVTETCIYRIADELARFTVDAAEERRREGRLEFHDLLVLARNVLRDPERGPEVRARLRLRYQRLLLDEFQDTDPIQIELAVLIAGGDDPAGRPWPQIGIDPGRVFFVGDPKQSIYRFRRADIAMFLTARDSLVDRPDQLMQNFRTGEPIVEWVNRTFGQLIVESNGSQPGYVELVATRPGPSRGAPVVLLGPDEHPARLKADDLREREAADVAAAIRRAVEEQWTVADGPRRWRPAKWGDIAILLPARTSLPMLEDALVAAGVPYRAETSSIVYATREVRDLLATVRAIDDPTDMLSLTAALRSAVFGCGDDDLYDWKVNRRGRWDHQAPKPDGCPDDHPVARAMAWLARMHRQRTWLSPSEIVDAVVRERKLMELAFVHTRPRDIWRRLRFVVDQARAWEEAARGSLRDYLTWVELQSAESARVVETVLPETDDDSVRIMTVHGAKGLEFPIVVLSGTTTQLRRRNPGVQVRFPADQPGWAIKLGRDVLTAEYEQYRPRDEQMDHDERLRLLYVAATRARDHLIVSAHRKAASGPGGGPRTAGEIFWVNGNHDDVVEHFTVAGREPHPVATQDAFVDPLPITYEAWAAERDRALRAGTRRLAVSATALAEELAAADPGLAKEPRELDLPPWQKGRYGTAVGRAVHAVLQTVDLRTGAGIAEAAAAQAAAEGIADLHEVVARLAGSAVTSEFVRSAIEHAHWREVYVGTSVGGVVLEGYIDLLYRSGSGLVVVDYKTDAWVDEAALDAKVLRYRPQLAAYCHAIAAATNEVVVAAALVFLSETHATVRDVPDLQRAMVAVAGAVTDRTA